MSGELLTLGAVGALALAGRLTSGSRSGRAWFVDVGPFDPLGYHLLREATPPLSGNSVSQGLTSRVIEVPGEGRRRLLDTDVVVTGSDAGIGSVPSVANIEYEGFVVLLRPSQFLELVADRPTEPRKVRELVGAGETVGMPFLGVSIDGSVANDEDVPVNESGNMRMVVTSHEGRGRMMAIREQVGDHVLVPVAILPRHWHGHDFEIEHFIDARLYGREPYGSRIDMRPSVTVRWVGLDGRLYRKTDASMTRLIELDRDKKRTG